MEENKSNTSIQIKIKYKCGCDYMKYLQPEEIETYVIPEKCEIHGERMSTFFRENFNIPEETIA
jgi:hypothetical protein